MTSPVLTTPTHSTVEEAANLMLVNRIGSVVVLDENDDYAGILTERMLLPEEVMVPFMRGKTFRLLGQEVGDLRYIEETMEKVRSLKVGDVMGDDAPGIDKNTPISRVVELMVTRNAHHVCVVEGRKPVGIVSRHDLMRLFFDRDHSASLSQGRSST